MEKRHKHVDIGLAKFYFVSIYFCNLEQSPIKKIKLFMKYFEIESCMGQILKVQKLRGPYIQKIAIRNS